MAYDAGPKQEIRTRHTDWYILNHDHAVHVIVRHRLPKGTAMQRHN